VFGVAAKKEHNYDGVKPTRSAWDSNKVTSSGKFLGVIWDTAGGGAFGVIDANSKGKQGQLPLVAGHSGEVLDIEFNPFNDNIIASVSDDGYCKIWRIPEGGLTENITTPVQSLSGHKRKVGTLNHNPIANNILATTSTDMSVKIWDVEAGSSVYDISGHSDIIQSSCWNWSGDLYATASKDKKIRVIDPRSNSIISEVEAHAGVKGMRVAFLGAREKIFSMGFSKTSERQFTLWEPRKLTEPLRTENIDTAAGIIMPFYDNDNSILYLAGKGDGNIRYYELVDDSPFIHFLTEYKSATPRRGMGWTPKKVLDLQTCEIARLLKVTGTAIEPISFFVPRKSDIFQDDLYPPTYSGEPTLTSKKWIDGEKGEPKTMNLSPGFVPPKPTESKFSQAPATEHKKERSAKELQDENEKQAKRIAYLEAELAKKDAKSKNSLVKYCSLSTHAIFKN